LLDAKTLSIFLLKIRNKFTFVEHYPLPRVSMDNALKYGQWLHSCSKELPPEPLEAEQTAEAAVAETELAGNQRLETALAGSHKPDTRIDCTVGSRVVAGYSHNHPYLYLFLCLCPLMYLGRTALWPLIFA